MKKAKIENGVVVNIIEVDPSSIPDWCADWPEATSDAVVGGTYSNGVFEPPAPQPSPVIIPQSISFAQLLIGLVAEAWITEAEGEAWLAGTLPFAVLTVIDGLPTDQRFPAKARALRPSAVLRADPLVASMGAAAGKTDAEIDTFFVTYSQA